MCRTVVQILKMSSKPVAPKRRNNEKRKERSRVAARCRRTRELHVFGELSAALPVPAPARAHQLDQLDKASLMRLAISYLRVRDLVSKLPELSGGGGGCEAEGGELGAPAELGELGELACLKALDGFVLVLSRQGDVVYCSENITKHLGITQLEMMGARVLEFVHPCEHDEVRDALRGGGGARSLLLRLKCTLTARGRSVHLKSATYKAIHLTGHMLGAGAGEGAGAGDGAGGDKKGAGGVGGASALVAVGRPIPHPANIEVPLHSGTFLTKHALDMTFTYADDTVHRTLGFECGELVGRPLYEYHHAADSAALHHQFKTLFSKGQCETDQYRFLARDGGYAWLQTQATLITDKQQRPVSVVCVNYVISGIECKDEVFAAHQIRPVELKIEAPKTPAVAPPIVAAAVVPAPLEEVRPTPATAKIFAPRTEEMNKGFLFPNKDQELTMVLKDEPNPDDLLLLAPTAGDACIPLEDNPFDMIDDLICGDNYYSLLGDDLTSSPVESFSDPLLSSPETLESESSCEQTSLLSDLPLHGLDASCLDGDLNGRAPYIPMSDDELPIVETAVMWGAHPENVIQARPVPPETVPAAPALQRLLTTPGPHTGPPPQDLISNIYRDPGLMPEDGLTSWDTGMKRTSKQRDEPSAKRMKRSPSASPPPPASSSVLMNLLDVPRSVYESLPGIINRTTSIFNTLPCKNVGPSVTPTVAVDNNFSLRQQASDGTKVNLSPNNVGFQDDGYRFITSLDSNASNERKAMININLTESVQRNSANIVFDSDSKVGWIPENNLRRNQMTQNYNQNVPSQAGPNSASGRYGSNRPVINVLPPSGLNTNIAQISKITHTPMHGLVNTITPSDRANNSSQGLSSVDKLSLVKLPSFNSYLRSNTFAMKNLDQIATAMSPLSLSVGSQHSTPVSSPMSSPSTKDRLLSPYSRASSLSPLAKFGYNNTKKVLSPNGVMQTSTDPFLSCNDGMQMSPGIPSIKMDTGPDNSIVYLKKSDGLSEDFSWIDTSTMLQDSCLC